MRYLHSLQRLSLSSRLELLQWFVAIAFLCTFIISPQLWMDHRLIPTAPAFGQAELPFFLNYFLVAVLLISVLLGPLVKSGWMELISASVLGFLICYDLQRFQLEIYLFLIWFLTIGLYKKNWISEMAFLPTIQLSVLAMYLVGGAMKLNPWFNANIYNWVISPLNELPGGGLISRAWLLAPASEIALGLLLMCRATRFFGVIIAIGYHLLMLYLFGPIGNNYHQLMWPMQAVLIPVVILVFSAEEFKNPFRYVISCTAPKVAVALFFLMPILHVKGYFDATPSFAGYDGRHYLGYVAVEEYVVQRLPWQIRMRVKKIADHDKYLVAIDNWVSEELKVPFYHEKRVYMRYKRWLEPYANHPGDVFAVVMQKGEIEIIQSED